MPTMQMQNAEGAMTTDSEIRKLCEEVEEYCSKATPGPWKYHNRDDNGFYPAGDNERCVGIYSTHNAYFIARARTDLPKLLSLLRARMEEDRWIPVSERLPEEGAMVLAHCVDDNTDIGGDRYVYDMVHDYSHHDTLWKNGFITHWKPISAPEVQK